MTNLQTLASELGLELHGESLEISGVAQSSDLVKSGYLFAALEGAKHHGIDFAQQAIEGGAVAIFTDQSNLEKAKNLGVPVLVSSNPISKLSEICKRSYDISGLRLFGVTGTNGKTSTVTYLAWLLEKLGTSCGYSASTQRKVGSESFAANLTTPQVTEVYELLHQMKIAGNKAAVIEVSAQALVRHRIDGIRFAVSGFSNLSRDHLDDFGSMDSYLEAKKLLFTEHSDFSVINVEDSFGVNLKASLKDAVSIGVNQADWKYEISKGLPATLSMNVRGHRIQCLVPGGSMMAKNLALAIAMAISAGYELKEIEPVLANVDVVVPGRLERVSPKQPAVFVDYAHTPDGVAAAVEELRASFKNLVVVLGASGNRDQGKRSGMALAAASADMLIISDQHPRDEDPAVIRKALMDAAKSAMQPEKVLEIADPKEAITKAVNLVSQDGAVLWCGPGHLTYREISGSKVPFDAITIARNLVEANQ